MARKNVSRAFFTVGMLPAVGNYVPQANHVWRKIPDGMMVTEPSQVDPLARLLVGPVEAFIFHGLTPACVAVVATDRKVVRLTVDQTSVREWKTSGRHLQVGGQVAKTWMAAALS